MTTLGHSAPKFREMVQRRDSKYIGRRRLRFELPGRRTRRQPERRFVDVVKEDIKVGCVREEEAKDKVRWRQLIRCGDPCRDNPEKEED